MREISSRAVATLLLLVICLVAGWYYVAVKGEQRSAFNRWQPIVNDLVQGKDVYYLSAFPTPPIMGLILYPFALLPGTLAMASWFAFKVLTTAVGTWWLLGVIDPSGKLPRWAAVAVIVFASRPILGDLLHGNVNLWILFCIVASIWAFCGRHDVTAGMWLSLAIACKLTPLLLLLYFLVKRAWKVSLATLGGLVLWWVIVPGFVLGFSHNQMLLCHWADMMVWPYVREGQVDTEQVNQSLVGLVHRLGTESVAIKGEKGQPDLSVHLVALSSREVANLTRCIVLGLFALLFWRVRHKLTDRTDPQMWHELGLVLLVMLLVSERSWKHHYVTVLPCVIALAAFAEGCTAHTVKGGRKVIWGAICVAAIVMALTSNDIARPFFGVHGAKLAQAYGAYVWAALVLAGTHFWVLGKLSVQKAF